METDRYDLSTAEVNGTQIAYQRTGEGPAVLLLHGAFISHKEWVPQIAALASHFEVIAPDVRAHGSSSKEPGDYSIALFAEDMMALLDALEIRSAIVCGHSMGGMLAQHMAVIYPERVHALVLAETNFGTRGSWFESAATNLSMGMMRLIGIRRVIKLVTRQIDSDNTELKALFEQDMGAYVNTPEIYWAIADCMEAYDGRENLNKITCPALILVGERNRMTHRQAKIMAASIPDAKLKIIPKAGHLLNWDNPEEFNQAVITFCLAASK